MFGETNFVPRSVAEQWVADAREDAIHGDDGVLQSHTERMIAMV